MPHTGASVWFTTVAATDVSPELPNIRSPCARFLPPFPKIPPLPPSHPHPLFPSATQSMSGDAARDALRATKLRVLEGVVEPEAFETIGRSAEFRLRQVIEVRAARDWRSLWARGAVG
jgi:hypothetical protein